jgi:antitoxin (DNA-binding transcriptional repressor) of toxin-antitoxin stability system
MRSVSISVTEASRNFAECINRARYQGTIFILHKNGVAVARIVPMERKAKIADELDAAEESLQTSDQGAEDRLGRCAREIW